MTVPGASASMRPATRWSADLLLLGSVCGSLAVAGLWLRSLLQADEGGGGTETAISVVALSAVMIAYGALGWLVIRRMPDHAVGWILLWTPLLAMAVFSGFAIAGDLAASRGIDDFLAGAVAWMATVAFLPFFLFAAMLLPLLFPDGRLPGPRWRVPVEVVLGTATFVVLCFAFVPGQPDAGLARNPFGIPGLPIELRGLAGAVTGPVIVAGGIIGVASVMVRFRRGRGQERQQIKWMLAAVAVVVAVSVPGWLGLDLGWLAVISSLALGLVPGAVTVAILRYRLYDIDRLISRTVGYAIVTALLVATFAAGYLALQTALASLTQADTIAVAGSTLLAFAVAQPLWRRIRRVVDRRFDRTRVDAERTLRAFAERQRDRVDLEAMAADVRQTAYASLRPATVSIWLRRDGD
jgi:hypothetical protein